MPSKANLFKKLISLLLLFCVCLILLGVVVKFSINLIKDSKTLQASVLGISQDQAELLAIEQLFGENEDPESADIKTKQLAEFLESYHSPLTPYAGRMVFWANEYQIHYGLVPAIALVESGLCKTAPADSFNCWGWGIWGKKVTKFASYEEAIERVSRGLREEYYDKGFDTPEKIMKLYNPTNHNNWLGKVKKILKNFN